MNQSECLSEIKKIQENLQKDRTLLATTLSRIFDAEARIQKLRAYLKEKRSAKIADWNNPEFAAARLSICSTSRPHAA